MPWYLMDLMINECQSEFIFCPLFSVNSEVNCLLANHPSSNTGVLHIIKQNGKSIEAVLM